MGWCKNDSKVLSSWKALCGRCWAATMTSPYFASHAAWCSGSLDSVQGAHTPGLQGQSPQKTACGGAVSRCYGAHPGLHQTNISQCESSGNVRDRVPSFCNFRRHVFTVCTDSRAEFSGRKEQITGCLSYNLLEQGRFNGCSFQWQQVVH